MNRLPVPQKVPVMELLSRNDQIYVSHYFENNFELDTKCRL